jgi:hypothetical protein
MKETIDTIIQWYKETFPNATLEEQLMKYQEEQIEWVESDYTNVKELADMFIVACGIARFDAWEGLFYMHDVYDWYLGSEEIHFDEVKKAINEKMEKNRKRVWNKADNGTYHHESGGINISFSITDKPNKKDNK